MTFLLANSMADSYFPRVVSLLGDIKRFGWRGSAPMEPEVAGRLIPPGLRDFGAQFKVQIPAYYMGQRKGDRAANGEPRTVAPEIINSS